MLEEHLQSARDLLPRKPDLREEPQLAVVVQRMVNSERSGVMFTADPATSDRSRVVIEAAFGLGEVVVSGQVEPDTYVVSKQSSRIQEVHIGVKTHKIVRAGAGDARVELSPEQADARVLSDDEVVTLAKMAVDIEEHYGTPQDVEWAIERDKIYIVQSRPITTLHEADSAHKAQGKELLTGLGASPGVVSGAVRVLRSAAEGASLKQGEILRGSHDQSRLGPHLKARRSARHRWWWHDLPCRDR